MRTFHCDRCDADLIDWPMSPSVDESGALMPTTSTREAHAQAHATFDANGWDFVPVGSEV